MPEAARSPLRKRQPKERVNGVCSTCEPRLTGAPVRDTIQVILHADVYDMMDVTCVVCGKTDMRIRGLMLPAEPEVD